MKTKIVLLFALLVLGCSYRVVIDAPCDASLEVDADLVDAGVGDAGPPPPCESECAYDTETGLLYFVHRQVNEVGVCKTSTPELCGEVCDVEIGCGPS